MTLTRREFIAGSVGTILIGSNAESFAATFSGLRVRRNIYKISPRHPDLLAYREAVRAMKGRSDKHGWSYQAEIHGNQDIDKNGKVIRGCRHASWLFFPWHRAYLHYFEEAVRQITGKEDFALPYWNWHQHRRIPSLFWKDPLFHDRGFRPRQRLSDDVVFGRRIVLGFTSDGTPIRGSQLDQALLSPFDDFAGLAFKAGDLEFGPHNMVHDAIGYGGKDMSMPKRAAFDPVFWPHHAYVDRLWAKWVSKNTHTPSDSWLDERFSTDFVDRAQDPVSVSVRELLDVSKLGYRYDDIPVNVPSQLISITTPLRKFQPLDSRAVNIDVTQRTPLRYSLEMSREAAQAVRNIVTSTKEDSPRVIARLRDVAPNSANFLVRSFLNCPYFGSDTDPDTIHFVNSFAFFSHHAGHTSGMSVDLDITRTLTFLNRTSSSIPSTIEIQALIKDLADEGGSEQGFKVGSIELGIV